MERLYGSHDIMDEEENTSFLVVSFEDRSLVSLNVTSWPALSTLVTSSDVGSVTSPSTSSITFDPKVLEALEEFRDRMTKNTDAPVLFLVALYVLVFCLGVLGNSIILFWVTKSRHFVQGRYRNYVLINLCVADLLVVLICCPMATYSSISRVWLLNETMCKTLAYLQGVAVTSGTLALTTLSLDRYLYTRHPSLFQRVRRHQLSGCMILSVWLLSVTLALPILLIRTLHPFRVGTVHAVICVEAWRTDLDRRSFTVVTLVVVYAIPCAVLILCHASVSCTLCHADQLPSELSRNDLRQRAFRVKEQCSTSCSTSRPHPPQNRAYDHSAENSYTLSRVSVYSDSSCCRHNSNGGPASAERHSHTTQRSVKSKRHLANVLMGMTICFVICWLPYHVTSFCVDLHSSPWLASLLPFTLLLGHAHSAINPVVYWMLNRGARRKIHGVFKLRSSLIRKHTHMYQLHCLPFNTSKETPTTTDNLRPKFIPCRESDMRL